MNKDINKAINRLVELSAGYCLTGTYDNNVVSINFKVTEKFDLDRTDNKCYLSYVTENNASPAEVKFKLSDVKNVEHFAEGEYVECPYIELIRFIFTDGSVMEFLDDIR